MPAYLKDPNQCPAILDAAQKLIEAVCRHYPEHGPGYEAGTVIHLEGQGTEMYLRLRKKGT